MINFSVLSYNSFSQFYSFILLEDYKRSKMPLFINSLFFFAFSWAQNPSIKDLFPLFIFIKDDTQATIMSTNNKRSNCAWELITTIWFSSPINTAICFSWRAGYRNSSTLISWTKAFTSLEINSTCTGSRFQSQSLKDFPPSLQNYL